MTHRLHKAYLHWLEQQVREGSTHQKKTYIDLMEVMHAKEFVWQVPNDDNRIADALDLRREFISDGNHHRLAPDELGPVSFLEVLIALSRRLSFQAGGNAEGWAWQFLCNLELHRMPDPLSRYKARRADEIMDTVIWRNYAPDGTGGFFPLAFAEEDQRKVEIWYQMAAYVREIHPEY
jgi:hypothetical protein